MTETTEQNVYQKLAEARARLSALKLKKTGNNTYSNFTYYELSDFLPSINELNKEIGLMTFFQIKKDENGEETAYLDVINTAKPEEIITFNSETANVEIGKKRDGSGGADPIQNIGGKQTYLRRYLMIMAYEISEVDTVDRQEKKPQPQKLDKESVDKINSAKDLDELAAFGKELLNKLGSTYRQSIEAQFRVKKAEIEAQANQVIEKKPEAEGTTQNENS